MNNLEVILKYTGLAGLSITILFLLFKNIIRKNIFPRLSQDQGYKILRLIIVLVFIMSMVSIITYSLLNKPDEKKITPPDTTIDSNPQIVNPPIVGQTIAKIASYLNTPLCQR